MIEFPSKNWKDYELLDSGNGEKLERFGRYILIRPEPKALWTPSMSAGEWKRLAHVHFRPGAGFGKAGKEDSGTWDKLREMEDQWYIRYGGWNAVASEQARAKAEQAGWQTADAGAKAVQAGPSFSLRLGLTSFKHVGVFPEQAPNWEFIYQKVQALRGVAGLGSEGRNTRGSIAGGPSRRDGGVSPKGELPPGQGPAAPKVLNLFAYTGGASLAAKAAGADVTHLDSVRQVVSWARGNMERSGLDGIRWVVEDAMKFASREAKRGHLYDGIILDILLPGMTGLGVLAEMRGKGNSTPVLLLTALGDVEDRVAGLDAGADDYLVKPFDFDELMARIRSMTRRSSSHTSSGFSSFTARISLCTSEQCLKRSTRTRRISLISINQVCPICCSMC